MHLDRDKICHNGLIKCHIVIQLGAFIDNGDNHES